MKWIAAIACVLLFPVAVETCSIGPPVPLFVTEQHPAQVQKRFAKGNLGIVRRSFDPIHFIAAFRILSGKPFTNEQIETLYPKRQRDQTYILPNYGVELWRVTRTSVAPDSSYLMPSEYKTIDPGSYAFVNCNDHTFATAAKTLIDLREKWGVNDERFVAWVLAQDMVFEDCRLADPKIPEPPGQKMDPLAAVHRRYQIAAAQFYGGQYREAALSFHAIGEDEQSPWRYIAPYLTARALMRAGQFLSDPDAYKEAIASLEFVLSDPAREEWHESSRGLLARLKLRTEPDKRLVELGEELLSDDVLSLRQNAIDLLFLAENRNYIPKAEMGAWVEAMLHRWDIGGNPRTARTIDHWRKQGSPAWLIAALALATTQKDIDELLQAASRTADPKSPAYESFCYYAAVQELGRKRWPSARLWADRGLSKPGLDASSRNLLLAVRMRAAANWAEFLQAALRSPERGVYEFDGKEMEDGVGVTLPGGAIYGFDHDAVEAFNKTLPLRLWIDAASHPALPAAIQLRVAQSAWFRAAMLDRHVEAKQLMRRIVELNPAVKESASHYLDAGEDPHALRFAAVYTYLRAPLLSPSLREAYSETANLAKPHVSRACPEKLQEPRTEDFPPFLSTADRNAAQQEIRLLAKTPQWHATFALREAVTWTKLHPGDPRTPEALHRGVRMSFYGCRDTETGKYSQEAFNILHRKYAATSWAAQTKHWYR
jgi:hypothetical protein